MVQIKHFCTTSIIKFERFGWKIKGFNIGPSWWTLKWKPNLEWESATICLHNISGKQRIWDCLGPSLYKSFEMITYPGWFPAFDFSYKLLNLRSEHCKVWRSAAVDAKLFCKRLRIKVADWRTKWWLRSERLKISCGSGVASDWEFPVLISNQNAAIFGDLMQWMQNFFAEDYELKS